MEALCPLARLDATKNTNDVCRMMCTPFFFLALLTSSLCTESPTHTYSGSYVSNTKGSALRDAGCVVRVGQGVLEERGPLPLGPPLVTLVAFLRNHK